VGRTLLLGFFKIDYALLQPPLMAPRQSILTQDPQLVFYPLQAIFNPLQACFYFLHFTCESLHFTLESLHFTIEYQDFTLDVQNLGQGKLCFGKLCLW
jgi:hypothetical protein